MEPEAEINAALDAGQLQEALRLGMVHYGAEILSFLAAVHSSQEQAAEVLAEASADLVRGIGGFERRSSFRTWFYAVAKNASRRYFDDSYQKRRIPLSEAPEVAQALRTTTAEFLQTEWKDRLRALRDQLEPVDRSILILRVDRQMSWAEVAEVLRESEPGTAATSAAVRKRFERIKAKLREEAARAGWPLGE